MPVFNFPLFAGNHSTDSYLFDQSEFSNEFASKQNLCLPIAHDSEWVSSVLAQFFEAMELDNRCLIATGVKHIFNKPLCFFSDYAINETGYDYLYPMESDFVICDYLNKLGINTEIVYLEDNTDLKIPYLDIWLYTYLGIVDLILLAKKDSSLYDFIKLKISQGVISHQKRLTSKWNRPVKLPVVINIQDINGEYHSYQLRFVFIDSVAIHGKSSLKSFYQTVGIDTTVKSLMDNYKSDMLTGLKLHPKEFIEYTLGDLNLYDALVAYSELTRKMYMDMSLIEYYIQPKLTIGSTVIDLISASIFKWKNLKGVDYHEKIKGALKRKTILNDLMLKSSAQYLQCQTRKSRLSLLGKVHGGRCRNNNPIMRFIKGVLVDSDYSGAYSSSMMQLPVFTGEPWFFDSAVKGELSLGEFKKRYLHQFDDWHYEIVVSTKSDLSYKQDLIVSWVINAPKDIPEKPFTMPNGDKVNIRYLDYSWGYTKIFHKEIINGVITSDTIKWIDSLGKKVKDDFYNKCTVLCAMGYKRQDKGKTWDSINLGELLIKEIIHNRVEYQKLLAETNESKYDSMQALYKLFGNTVFGDLCSKFFVTSNVLVANQITQNIRLAMYLKEKVLNLYGSITDGCIYSLNHVLYPLAGRKIHLEDTVNLYQLSSDELGKGKYQYRLGALDNAKSINLTWKELENPIDIKGKKVNYLPVLTIDYVENVKIIEDVYIDGKLVKNIANWINEKSLAHLKTYLPDFNYLFDYMKIEIKDIYDSAIYHSAANYTLENPNGVNSAMRGYEGKKGVIGLDLVENELVKNDIYDNTTLPLVFLSQLKQATFPKLPPCFKTKILKSKEYKP